MKYKLGKTPARKDAVTLRLKDYVVMVKPPATYGHGGIIPSSGWQMLGNDNYGDCVLAGGAHETMLWNAEAGSIVTFDDNSVLSDYSAITGFNPDDPNSDQGTDMQIAASYRKKTGLKDAQGKRHKVGAYLAITPGSPVEFKQAMYMFSDVGVGIQFPASAMVQFNAGKTWTVNAKSKIQGGHYVPAIGYSSRYVYLITWGKMIRATWGFINRYCDEAIVYLSPEMLKNGVSLEGFNLSQLQADLKQI